MAMTTHATLDMDDHSGSRILHGMEVGMCGILAAVQCKYRNGHRQGGGRRVRRNCVYIV